MLASRPQSLDATVSVETPEHVAFSYSIAGIGARAAAALIDYLICVALLMAFVFIWGVQGPWAVAVVVIVQFVIVWGYYVLFEGLNDGQTPGKRWLRLRVVQDGGYSVSFAASAVRNLARVVDLQPVVTYAVGVVSIAATKSGKRIGDLLAGTIVVRERAERRRVAAGPAPADAPVVLHTLLTDDEYALVARFIERRDALDKSRRAILETQLAARFRSRVPDANPDDAEFLRALAQHERSARSRGVAARSDTGAAREQHALVAAGQARWDAFAARIVEVQSRRLSNLSEREVSDFVAEYRELTTDLARLQTAARGRDIDELFTLGRLVAAGHNVLYRQNTLTPRIALDFLAEVVPREIRRSAAPIALAALMMFGPAAIAWVAVVRHPAVAASMLPPGMLERAEQGVSRAKNEEGYIPDPELMRPVMASSIIANNVQVTFLAFAFGITAGIGTLALLIFNGVSFGSVLGLYQSKGILSLILAFVAPHSVLELSAICIAGGGGLLIAQGIWLPGGRTRREAIVDNGRRAIRLVAGAGFLLVIAGTIEGFISPIPWWPMLWKVSVTAISALFLAGFVSLGGRSPTLRSPTAP